MFDAQARHGRAADLPEDALASIAGYYRRVTTDSRPMNLLVGAAMPGLLGGLLAQLAADDPPDWTALASLALGGGAIAVAVGHTFRAARRLGARRDSTAVQSAIARSILRDHLLCLT